MKSLFYWLLGAAGLLAQPVLAQPAKVQKTNSLPVYMHYMPWFETPATNNGQWGYHWTFNNQNPNVVDGTGKRQIASHFYPLIGPYASSDPDVVEYHLLLLKLAGVDGVLVDWYGSVGSNGDVGSLLRNSNALIDRTASTGLQFGLIAEDRFWGSVGNGQTNLAYAKNNYFGRSNYIRVGGAPLLGVFGPITFTQPSQWTSILGAAGQDTEFLSLWDNDNAGANADGQYVWIYQSPGQSNFYSYLESYYRDRAPSKKTVMAVAYPGFYDFYAEGGAGQSYFNIPHSSGQTLDQTLGLVDKYRGNVDLLQLATFNDFGEGTMFEPTQETGFSYLARVQKYTGVPYTESDLKQVYRLYTLRKKYAGNADKQSQLSQAFNNFVALRLPAAVAALDAADGTAPPPASGVATVYRDCNYGGTATSLPAGDYSLSQLQAKGILDNDLSSLQVNAGYQLVLYENDTFTGASLTLTANTGCLVSNPRGSGNWNDQASSLRVQAAPAFSQQLEAEAHSGNHGFVVENCSEGGQDMGYADAGDYLVWNNITIPSTGSYLLEYRVASGASGGTISADLNAGSVQLGSTSIPGTGGWQNWKTVSQTVSLNAGTYDFGIYAQTGGFNLNWVRLSKATTGRESQVLAAASAAPASGPLTLYPNPVAERLSLDGAANLLGTPLSIVNLTGQEVWRGTYQGQALDVSGLRAGLYTLLSQNINQQRIARQFVKQ